VPLSQLDNHAALVVIDLQKGIVALPTVHPAADVVAKSASIARAFRAKNHPVVLVNISTSIGIEFTARYASELGYDVVMVTDAMTDLNAAAHENSVKMIFPRIGETVTTDELLKVLGQVQLSA